MLPPPAYLLGRQVPFSITWGHSLKGNLIGEFITKKNDDRITDKKERMNSITKF